MSCTWAGAASKRAAISANGMTITFSLKNGGNELVTLDNGGSTLYRVAAYKNTKYGVPFASK